MHDEQVCIASSAWVETAFKTKQANNRWREPANPTSPKLAFGCKPSLLLPRSSMLLLLLFATLLLLLLTLL